MLVPPTFCRGASRQPYLPGVGRACVQGRRRHGQLTEACGQVGLEASLVSGVLHTSCCPSDPKRQVEGHLSTGCASTPRRGNRIEIHPSRSAASSNRQCEYRLHESARRHRRLAGGTVVFASATNGRHRMQRCVLRRDQLIFWIFFSARSCSRCRNSRCLTPRSPRRGARTRSSAKLSRACDVDKNCSLPPSWSR